MAFETNAAVRGSEVSPSGTVNDTGPKSTPSRALGILGNIFQMREMAMVILILFTCVIMSIFSPYFLSISNFIAIARGF